MFAHTLERGGMRRAWPCGREDIHKRYLIHVADHSILMRLLIGADMPKEAAVRGRLHLIVVYTEETLAMAIFAGVAPGANRRATACSLYSGENRRLVRLVIAAIQIGRY